VLAGLSEAFNTFGFEVGLAILLFVARSLLEQAEQRLLAAVDRQVSLVMAEYLVGEDAAPQSQSRQLQQLTQTLESLASTLGQQSEFARRAQPLSRLASGTSSPEVPSKEIETAVQRAIASALERHTPLGPIGSPAALDAAGWKSLQQLLQRLADVLEQQNAQLETDGRVSKQLSAIIDEGPDPVEPRRAASPGPKRNRDFAATAGR
jgi:hypothetical protein